MKTCAIAVDIGGTKIATGYIDLAQPMRVHARATRPTCAQQGSATVLTEVIAAISQIIDVAVAAGFSPVAVGIGAPGVVDPEQGIIVSAGHTMPGWAGTNVAAAVAQATGLPVAMHNDVRVMGLGEAIHGAGKGYGDVLFVSIGTGIGGAIITHGALETSPHFSRGEIAYLYAPTPTGGCDIIENIGSGPALTRAYREQCDRECEDIDLREIMRRYRQGDTLAHTVIEQGMTCVGQGLAGLINAVDVEAVIVGGGVGTIGQAILTPLTRALHDELLPAMKNLPIVPAKLGTDAPLVGAGYLATTTL
ncbi:MAG: ROK family protein [Corynebacterium sp.]|nr:ROK family protein [Corynebacterium sp.]